MKRLPARLPALTLPRPALQLLHDIGHGRVAFTFQDAAATSARPRSSVARHLAALVEAGLLVRLRKEAYASPGMMAHAVLLVEPDAYARRLLALSDVLARVGTPYALACLPVRAVFSQELPRPIPVLDLAAQDDILRHDAARLALRPAMWSERIETFPTGARREPDALRRNVPVLHAAWALAVLAATSDPRLVNASVQAATALGVAPADVLERAASFVVEETLPKRAPPNTLVLPHGLAESARSARSLHAQRFLDSAGGARDG